MLHLDEITVAEIYAGDGIVVGKVKRGKEVVKPWVSRGVSFGTFLSLVKEKYEHSRNESVNESIPQSASLTAPFTQGSLWCDVPQ